MTDTADTDPFAETDDLPAAAPTGGGDGDDFVAEVPPLPIGVLSGYVKDAKPFVNDDRKVILDIQLDEPPFQAAAPVSIWFDTRKSNQLNRLLKFAAMLGVPTSMSGGQARITGGLSALKNKPGRFVFAPWEKDDGAEPQVAWGLPKPGKSALWDEHFTEANYTETQIAALKQSPGIVPKDF